MKQLRATAAALAALLGLVAVTASPAPASAATGQCFDRHGRAVGPPFNTFYPNRAFINGVVARGGTCTVAGDAGAPPPGAYGPGPYGPGYGPGQGYPYYTNPSNDPGGSHSSWCGSNPPSGYCIVPENR